DGLAAAREQFLDGDYAAAVKQYQVLATQPATEIAAHVGWTDVDDECGRYNAAIERLKKVAEKGASSSEYHAALAAMLERVGDYDAAIEHGRKAIELAEDNCRARADLGRLYEKLGRRDDAVEVYSWFDRTLQDKLPDRAEDLTNAGFGFYRFSVLTR